MAAYRYYLARNNLLRNNFTLDSSQVLGLIPRSASVCSPAYIAHSRPTPQPAWISRREESNATAMPAYSVYYECIQVPAIVVSTTTCSSDDAKCCCYYTVQTTIAIWVSSRVLFDNWPVSGYLPPWKLDWDVRLRCDGTQKFC